MLSLKPVFSFLLILLLPPYMCIVSKALLRGRHWGSGRRNDFPRVIQPMNTKIIRHSRERVRAHNEGCHQGRPAGQAATTRLHSGGFTLTNLLWSKRWSSVVLLQQFHFVSVLVFIWLVLRKPSRNWHMQPECLSIHLWYGLLLLRRLDSYTSGHILHWQATWKDEL